MPAGEAAPAVRCAALRCLVRVLATVDALPPSDSNLFTECAPRPAPACPLPSVTCASCFQRSKRFC